MTDLLLFIGLPDNLLLSMALLTLAPLVCPVPMALVFFPVSFPLGLYCWGGRS